MTQQPKVAGKSAPKKVPVRLIVALVLVALALTFTLQNRQTTEIHVFTTTISGPLWAALVGMLVIGLLVGFLLDRVARGKRQGQSGGR